MAMQLKNALALIALLCFSSSLVLSVSAQSSGIATFYTPPYVPSACFGFDVQGTMIASASESLWNNGAACGQRFEVTCLSGTNQGVPKPCLGSGSVTVTIVDRCPAPGCRGTIDLSQEAFASIADPNAGAINVSLQGA
ncbi:EG45-like domain containing protein [Punica granatum]|uniref:EG45-like domain containing protein n=2 Tax=Punica granatum TaxID=22663 RepID=A0A6P8ENJ0_PUNGR|nr:EG45-like domain containing protein [Punica granatum]PKI51840.1 hypothetical protein CRG98_027758 [Punica granatum]